MNKDKILKILKSKVIIGIICFFIGAIIMSDSDTPKELEVASSEIVELQSQLTVAQAKIEEAKPFFDMNVEEQAKLEAQAAKDKSDREQAEASAKAQVEAQAKVDADAKVKAQADAQAKVAADAAAQVQAALAAKTKILSNGNFISGQDFEAGTYDIIAVSGGGNVSSTNAYSGGINAIMGVANDDFYKLEYKNIQLPSGTTLKIDRVEIKLVPKS